MRCRKQFTGLVAGRKGGLDLGEFKQTSLCNYWQALKSCDAISDDEIPLCDMFLKLEFL